MLTIIPEPPAWKALLGFDLDGTLLMPRQDKDSTDDIPSLDPRFFDSIRWIRANYGAAWGICTGRSLYHLVEGMTEGKFPCLPDFAVVREREIYFPGQFGRWVPHEDWNDRSQKEHHRLFKKNKRQLAKIRKFVEGEAKSRWVEEQGEPAGVVAINEKAMQDIVDFLQTQALPPELSHERNFVYLRFSHVEFNKGSALREAGERWGIGKDKTLAVGDNHNDMSMMQDSICDALGCPANAIPEVREHVRKRGGVVASKDGSEGVIEILGQYFDP